MKTVTMLEFRRHANQILQATMRGQRTVLTYRGKPAVRLEPIPPETIAQDDPFYSLDRLAVDNGVSLTNREMDASVYER
jgi:prevent-host-death family protein